MTNVRLRDVTTDDLPLIERWLHADHVRLMSRPRQDREVPNERS
jgi:hypothetical protein